MPTKYTNNSSRLNISTESYEKTLHELKNNHKSPIILQALSHKNDESQISMINSVLEEELGKYNRIKLQKQKEAKFLYEEEIKKITLMKTLKDKERKFSELNERIQAEKVISLYFSEQFLLNRGLKLRSQEK